MLATQCSNPRKTNKKIGNQTAGIFPESSLAPDCIHTARTTSILHPIPLRNASSGERKAFDKATASAFSAIPPVIKPDLKTSQARRTAPVRFPRYTIPQFLNISPGRIFPSSTERMRRLFPVNSCPPQKAMSISPTGNAKAPIKRPMTGSRLDEDPATIKARPPNPIKTPPSKARINVSFTPVPAVFLPRSVQSRAIAAGFNTPSCLSITSCLSLCECLSHEWSPLPPASGSRRWSHPDVPPLFDPPLHRHKDRGESSPCIRDGFRCQSPSP